MAIHILTQSYPGTMLPLHLFKCLADETRLRCLCLIVQEQELCVCELTEALQLSQPKVSRHLARLKADGLVQDRREGQWVYYQLADDLPPWVYGILRGVAEPGPDFLQRDTGRLLTMGNRPQRKQLCC